MSALAEAESDVLKTMKDFVLEFSTKLGSIREVLSESLSEAWDSENDILSVSMEPFETAHVASMIRSDNVPLNKVFTVFAVLIEEMKALKRAAEDKYYGPLAMFGHAPDAASAAEAGVTPAPAQSMEAQLGAFLPFLQDLANFVRRVQAVVRNTVAQLACLYHERMKLWLTTFKHVELDPVYDALGELCTVLVTVDAVIQGNAELVGAWTAYKRMLKYARADPARYNAKHGELEVLDRLVVSLDERLMTTTAFGALLLQDYSLPDPANPDAPPMQGPAGAAAAAVVSGNRVFSQAFSEAVARILMRLRAGLAEPMETYERVRFVDLLSLYALYRAVFKASVKVDMKLFKMLWELQIKVPLVVLFGRSVWYVADFLIKYAPAVDNSSLKPATKAVLATRREILTALDADFAGRAQDLYLQTAVWMVRMESELLASQEHNAGTLLNARAKLLLHGLLLANQVRNVVLTSIHLHLALGVPFGLRNLRALATCVELLKSIQHTYRRRMAMIAENAGHMLSQTAFTLKKILRPLKAKLEKRDPAQARLNDTKADVYASLSLALDTLEMPATAGRRTVLSLALAGSQLKMLLKPEFEEEVRYQVWKMERLAAHQQQLAALCDCSFIYWVSNLVPAILRDLFNAPPEQAARLQYTFLALHDAAAFLARSAVSPAQQKELVSCYEAEARASFQTHFVGPLAQRVETDLRLHIHSVVLEQESLRAQGDNKDWSRVLQIKPLRLFAELIDVKEQVARRLDAAFYNHNTVALHDSKIYADMRNLAREKFGLELADPHLPGAAHYSEALDVLEIMRNIHIFVARYNYNMNTQIFVERAVDQKHLNIIDVAHIAASIQTHGTGIMNTTVNFTYQFLARKFVLFSEFLFDDHIKSPLLRDARSFKARRAELHNLYPYADAERFVRDVRKLGVTEAGATYLDQFRVLVTEIGNAMGYVRMVRSGGLHYDSAAIQFVPDLDAVAPLQPLCADSGLSPETIQAAANFDSVVSTLADNVSVGSEYFLMLVEVFAGVFQAEEQAHTRNFHVLVPAVTINFVETMLAKKEKLNKLSGRMEAAFTDDGFALGVAYCLRLLEQDADFDALHWFESVAAHLGKQKAQLEGELEAAKRARNKAYDAEHAALAVKRLEAVMVEFELLSFSFTGARVFFRDATRKDATEVSASGSTTNADAGAASNTAAPAPAAPAAAAAAAPPAGLTDIPEAPVLDFFL